MHTLATTRSRRLVNQNPERPQQPQQQPQTTNELIAALLAQHKVPSLDDRQLADLSHHLFTAASPALRFDVAGTVYLYDHDHPKALDIFLCCALPLAENYARRRAYRIFVTPSDWQIEVMYDGAVASAIEVFQRHMPLQTLDHVFRRYLSRALVHGALFAYYRREENRSVRAVADLAQIPLRALPKRHPAEEDIITRELLDQVTALPQLTPEAAATLRCIRTLGPDMALKPPLTAVWVRRVRFEQKVVPCNGIVLPT